MQENKEIDLFGISISCLTMAETVQEVEKAIENNEQLHHVVVNAAKIVKMQSDSLLRDSVTSCDIINADGQSIVWASKLLGKPLPERVAGIDLMQQLIKLAYKNKYKIYFLGAKDSILKKVVYKYAGIYSEDIIAGYRNGYFEEYESEEIARKISANKPDILFVAISTPKKEIFLHKHKALLSEVPFIMGVGGSFDVIAGKVKRAPVWMQKIGLEWFFRLIQEPGRMWKRYLYTNIQFVILVLKSLFRKQYYENN